MIWNVVGISGEGQRFLISGLDVWAHRWQSVDPGYVDVFEPTNRETHRLACKEIVVGAVRVRFAVAEVSYGAYLFAVPA